MGFCIFILSSCEKDSVPSVGLAAFTRSYQTSWFFLGGWREWGKYHTKQDITRFLFEYNIIAEKE